MCSFAWVSFAFDLFGCCYCLFLYSTSGMKWDRNKTGSKSENIRSEMAMAKFWKYHKSKIQFGTAENTLDSSSFSIFVVFVCVFYCIFECGSPKRLILYNVMFAVIVSLAKSLFALLVFCIFSSGFQHIRTFGIFLLLFIIFFSISKYVYKKKKMISNS